MLKYVELNGKKEEILFLQFKPEVALQDSNGRTDISPRGVLCTFSSSVPGVLSLTSLGQQILILFID